MIDKCFTIKAEAHKRPQNSTLQKLHTSVRKVK